MKIEYYDNCPESEKEGGVNRLPLPGELIEQEIRGLNWKVIDKKNALRTRVKGKEGGIKGLSMAYLPGCGRPLLV